MSSVDEWSVTPKLPFCFAYIYFPSAIAMLLHTFLLAALSIIFSSTVFGQYKFSKLEADIAVVLCFERDSHGYLWIGNDRAGIFRYNGYETKNYKASPEDPNSISDNFINQIFEDSKANLWIATNSGLNQYDRGLDSFTSLRTFPDAQNGSEDYASLSVAETSTNQLWVLGPKGLSRLNRRTAEFRHFPIEEGILGERTFEQLIIDESDRFWIVETGNTIWQFHPENGAFEEISQIPFEAPSRKRVYSDLSGDIWVSSYNYGLFKFSPETNELEHFPLAKDGTGLSGNTVREVIEYPKGQIVITIDQGGLNYYDKSTQTFTYQSVANGNGNGLNSDGTRVLYEDKEGILWVGTSRAGVNFHNPHIDNFTSYKHDPRNLETSIPGDIVGCLYEDQKGRIFIGTDGAGIAILDPKTNEIKNMGFDPSNPSNNHSKVIRSIDQTSDGRFWIATWDGGFYVLIETEDGKFVEDLDSAKKIEQFGSFRIWDLMVDSKDRIWVTESSERTFLFDQNLKPILVPPPGSSTVTLVAPTIRESANGEILLASPNGIQRYDEEKNVFELFLVIDKPTTASYEPQSQSYFVGTREKGIFRFDKSGNKIQHFEYTKSGKFSYINSLEIVSESQIWAATDAGLTVLDPVNNKTTTYYESDGLQSNHFFEKSSVLSRDKVLYFGGSNGFSFFAPNKIKKNTLLPYLSIDKINVNSRELSAPELRELSEIDAKGTTSLELNWKQKHLNFEFTGITMTSAKQNTYAYKLEGFDEEWVYTNARRRNANYTNLSPGQYTFRVKAANNDGVWNEKEASIAINIAPPFWQKQWFHLLSAIAIVSIIYLIILYREKKLKKEQLRLETMVREKTSELNRNQLELVSHQERLEATVFERTKELVIALDKAKESDQLKTQFLTNLSHEIRTPLNAITGFASFMGLENIDQETRKSYSEIINANSESLLTLIEDIIDFSMIKSNQMTIVPSAFILNEFIDNLFSSHALRNENKSIEHLLHNKLHADNLELFYDKMRVKQIIDNLMTNALKFTKNGHITLGVFMSPDTINFYVEDTGSGIPQDEIDKIFEKFVQLQVDEIAAKRGVGLGLAISHELTRLLGGTLDVHSEIGKGSTFTLSLPLRIAETSTLTAQAPEAPTRSASTTDSKQKILVIEDEHTNFQYINAALNLLGYQTEWAKDGTEGLEILRSTQDFHLVLLDIKMPGINGFDVLEQIRLIAPNLKVIAQTAYALKSDQVKIRNAGFDGYLSKPIQIDDLKAEIELTLEGSL